MSLSDQWTLATGNENGKVVISRIRLQAPAFATRATFPHFLVVLWPYVSPNENELPEDEELERMTKLENLLSHAFEHASQGFLSVVVTGNCLREWQWYVRNPKSTMELVNKTLGELEPFPIQFSFEEEDSDWEVYGRYLELTGTYEGGGL